MKKHCDVMVNGYCTNCPKKCFWKDHSALPYRLIRVPKEEVLVIKDMKQRWENARKKKQRSEERLKSISVSGFTHSFNVWRFLFFFCFTG